MKQVIAVVQPHVAEKILASLKHAPLEALTINEVRGYGRQKSYLDEYEESDFDQVFVPKVELCLWVDESRLDEILEKVVTNARCGRIGDGKIFVMPVMSFI